MSLLKWVSYVSACQRALCAYVLACQHALRAYVPTCLVCLRPHVPKCLACLYAHVSTCLACSRSHVPTCLRALRAYVLTCQCVLRVFVLTWSRAYALRVNVPWVLCVPTCPRAITANDKYKFSITCFLYIFVTVLCLFSCEIKLLYILAFLLPVRSL